jgi:hypothetical protein
VPASRSGLHASPTARVHVNPTLSYLILPYLHVCFVILIVSRSTISRPSFLRLRQQPRDQLAERLRSSSSQPRMLSLANCNMTLYIPSPSRSPQHTFASPRP